MAMSAEEKAESRRAASKKWRQANPEKHKGDPEKAKARHKRWRDANPEKIKAWGQEWSQANSEKKQGYTRKWKESDPQHAAMVRRMNENTRRARKLSQWVEDVDPDILWERDGGICHICSQPADPNDWHVEHKVALANGGEHSYANTAVSHPVCNLRKGVRVTPTNNGGTVNV